MEVDGVVLRRLGRLGIRVRHERVRYRLLRKPREQHVQRRHLVDHERVVRAELGLRVRDERVQGVLRGDQAVGARGAQQVRDRGRRETRGDGEGLGAMEGARSAGIGDASAPSDVPRDRP